MKMRKCSWERSVYFILLSALCAMTTLVSAEDDVFSVSDTSCRVIDQGIVTVDIRISGRVTALQDLESLRITGATVGPARVFGFISESLGAFSAGESKRFSFEGFIFTNHIDRNDLECIVKFEHIVSEPSEEDPPPDDTEDPPPDDTPGRTTYTTGDTIPGLTANDIQRGVRISNGNIRISGGVYTITLRAGGQFTVNGVTYHSDAGCVVSGSAAMRVTSGSVYVVSDSDPQDPPPSDDTPIHYVPVAGQAGQLILSEFMFESEGGLHAFPQWIEVFNTTDTAINLRGWQLEWYRKEPKLLDVTTTFLADFIIPASSARIITSVSGRNSGGNLSNAIYSLFNHHSTELDQNDGMNRNRLIARGGFYLKLRDANGTLIDEIGTVTQKESELVWELPETNIDNVRTSLIRRFDEGQPRAGTVREGWIRAVDTKAKHTGIYYGKSTDIGTPGYRSASEPLPVELSGFSAKVADDTVVLNWTTESEVDNAGFYIYRSETEDGEFKVVNPSMIQGAGTTGERTAYTWTDTTAKPNTVYYYRIEDVSHAGIREQLATVRLRGLVSSTGKLMTRWSDLKQK